MRYHTGVIYERISFLVLSYSFQVGGAAILGSYFWGKSKSIIGTIISNHIAIASDSSGKITIFKDELQKTAEEYHKNLIAIINIILGYGIAIFTDGCEYSDFTVLLLVIITTVIICSFEKIIVHMVVKHQFKSYKEIVIKDYNIPTGFSVFRYDATHPINEDDTLQ